MGSGFLLGDKSEGLYTIPGSDIFLGGGKSTVSPRLELEASAAPIAAEAESLRPRLNVVVTFVNGADPCRRLGSSDSLGVVDEVGVVDRWVEERPGTADRLLPNSPPLPDAIVL